MGLPTEWVYVDGVPVFPPPPAEGGLRVPIPDGTTFACVECGAEVVLNEIEPKWRSGAEGAPAPYQVRFVHEGAPEVALQLRPGQFWERAAWESARAWVRALHGGRA